jgi:hypothetical protein
MFSLLFNIVLFSIVLIVRLFLCAASVSALVHQSDAMQSSANLADPIAQLAQAIAEMAASAQTTAGTMQ